MIENLHLRAAGKFITRGAINVGRPRLATRLRASIFDTGFPRNCRRSCWEKARKDGERRRRLCSSRNSHTRARNFARDPGWTARGRRRRRRRLKAILAQHHRRARHGTAGGSAKCHPYPSVDGRIGAPPRAGATVALGESHGMAWHGSARRQRQQQQANLSLRIYRAQAGFDSGIDL